MEATMEAVAPLDTRQALESAPMATLARRLRQLITEWEIVSTDPTTCGKEVLSGGDLLSSYVNRKIQISVLHANIDEIIHCASKRQGYSLGLKGARKSSHCL